MPDCLLTVYVRANARKENQHIQADHHREDEHAKGRRRATRPDITETVPH